VGKNEANPSSFRKALFTAIDIFHNRKSFDKSHSNPLKKKVRISVVDLYQQLQKTGVYDALMRDAVEKMRITMATDFDPDGLRDESLAQDGTTEGNNLLVSSVVNSAFRNAFDALPTGDVISTEDTGIYKINALENISENLAVFGENNLVLMQFDFNNNLVPVETFKEVGIQGHWSADSDGNSPSPRPPNR